MSSLARPIFNLARDVDRSQELFWNEILDLCAAANQLMKYSFDDLYALYRREIDSGVPFPYLESIVLNGRIIGCLDQSFRRRPPLNRKLDNREIIFVLCDQYTLTNYNFSKKNTYIAETLGSMENTGISTIKYKILPMLPSRFVQANSGREFKIDAVYFGLNPYSMIEMDPTNAGYTYQLVPFHPAQPLAPPPGHQAMFNAMAAPPTAPPTAFYGDVNLMSQAMQQLGLGSASLPPQVFYGHEMVPPPPPPGALVAPSYFYNM